MRIISGKHKSKRLTAPKNLPVRPTTDMAKESLFNILNNRYYFQNIDVLDLFTGTGNISYEFASRGTENITAVDQNFHCIKFIKKTLKELDFEKEIFPVKSDVFSFLEKSKSKYDFIFADPPYDFSQELFLRLPNLIFKNQLLNDDGLLIVEHSPHTKLEEHPNYIESKKYGGVHFSFFKQ